MKKFKTTIKCMGCVAQAAPALDAVAGAGNWSVDLQDPDRVLSVRAEAGSAEVIAAVEKAGFKAELIPVSSK